MQGLRVRFCRQETIEDRENRAMYYSMLEKRKEEKAKCTAWTESLKGIGESRLANTTNLKIGMCLTSFLLSLKVR